MENKIDFRTKDKWDFENGFYLTSEPSRIGKILAHYELYKMIADIPGDIFEFGVYKGVSLIRFLTFRDIVENSDSRKIFGFDAFGSFPNAVKDKEDKDFIQKFELAGGEGISKNKLDEYILAKGFRNFELIEGNIFDTLPPFLSENPEKRIALLHIDVDVYEPTKFILEELWKRLVPGGLLVLDDYGTVSGETKAVEEFFSNQDIQINKLNFYKIPAFIKKNNFS